MQEYMKEQGAKIAPCCKFDVGYLNDGDIVVQNCTQCDFILKERCPQIVVTSLYEFVLRDPKFCWGDLNGKRITVQDCFRTRDDAGLQEAVRRCLRNMNAEVIEAEENHEETGYCGIWLNNPAAPDCAAVAPKTFERLEEYRVLLSPEDQKSKMENWVTQYTTEKVAVYCNGCEKGLRLGGLDPYHMIELLAMCY